MNVTKNVISILREDAWTSSNSIKKRKVDDTVDVSDLLKNKCDFSVEVPNNQIEVVLPTKTEKENECVVEIADFTMDNRDTFRSVTSGSNDPIWIMVNKKKIDSKKVKPVHKQMSQLVKIETTNEVSYLSNKCDLIPNKELVKLKSLNDTLVSNNTSSTRNLPNILRGPKMLSKSNTPSPIPFEMKDNYSLSTNNELENNISEKENNENTKKKDRKRKQIHNPLIMQEESTNLVTDSKLNNDDESLKKNKFDFKKIEKLTKKYQRKIHCKEKPFLFKNIKNKMCSLSAPMKETVHDSDSAPNTTMYTREQTEEQTSDLNFSSELNLFYKDQFHEDYIDHFDILTDTLKEYQVLNDSYDDKCYDVNFNSLLNFNDMKCPELPYKEFQNRDFIEQKEFTWDNTNLLVDNPFSDNGDCLHHKNNNCLTSREYLETMHTSSSDSNLEKASIHNLCNKNCLSGFFSDLSDDEFCLKNLSYNCLQNSFNKDEAKNLDTLLLEETKCETNLENHLNNDLNSSKINVTLTNATKNTMQISLSNDLEQSTIIRQSVNGQQNDQSDVILNTELSAKISSDYPEYIEPNDINLSEESHVPIETTREETEVHCNYRIEFNFENKDDKHDDQLTGESDTSIVTNENLNNINETKKVIKPLQCLLCPLTFTSKRTLALHLAGAHGDMYLILCERCGRLFNKKCIFNRHFIHCGCVKVPFSCKECNKTYRHKSSLLHHLKIVHQIENKPNTTKIYKCDICSKIYRKYGAFEKHLGIHIHS